MRAAPPPPQRGDAIEYGVNYAAVRYMKERGIVSEEHAAELEAGAVPATHVTGSGSAGAPLQ